MEWDKEYKKVNCLNRYALGYEVSIALGKLNSGTNEIYYDPNLNLPFNHPARIIAVQNLNQYIINRNNRNSF